MRRGSEARVEVRSFASAPRAVFCDISSILVVYFTQATLTEVDDQGVNGMTVLDVQVRGDAPLTVIALHGIQGTRDAWDRTIAAVERPVRWVLPNLRGRGAAWRGEGVGDYTLERYAEDLAQVVQTFAPLGPFVLAGWSLGASVALAALASSRIRMPDGLLLVSGSPALRETQWFVGEDAELERSIVARRERLALRTHADDDAVRWTWLAVRGTDQRELLPGLRGTKTAVLHGRLDTDCPVSHASWLTDGLGASQRICEGAGHALLAQTPAEVAAALDFLCNNLP